jgi:endonuclease/exonuclease/phosphatase family metal-dependent hydrolase
MGLLSFDSMRGFYDSLRIRARQEKIAELLYDDDSDIIALQEVHTYSFLRLLRSKLKKHPHVAYKKLLYGPRGSLVIFSKIPFEKIEYANFTDRGSILNTSIVAIVRRSGMLVAKLKDSNIYLINAHLTQNGDFVWNKKSRFYPYIRSQLNQVVKKIKNISLSNPESKIILLGDFNTDKNSTLYKSFLSSANLSDVFRDKKSATMHQEFLPPKKTARRIDYIFYFGQKSKPSVVKKSEVFLQKYLLGKSRMCYLSDHIGQKATFKF